MKWLVTEEFSDIAARLVDGDVTLIAPELLFAEAANALWALHRRGDIDASDYAEAMHVLKAAPVDVPATMRQLAPAAARLARDLNHPVYDCVYLALATQENVPVVTAYGRFHQVVRAHPYLANRVVHLRDVV